MRAIAAFVVLAGAAFLLGDYHNDVYWNCSRLWLNNGGSLYDHFHWNWRLDAIGCYWVL